MQISKDLYVCIPTKDRLILTQKAIESVWQNTTLFRNIFVYVFDNTQLLENNGRIGIFSQLLSEGKIHYYSNETDFTKLNIFPKALLVKRFLEMMKLKIELEESNDRMFLIMDNDMVLAERWDQFLMTPWQNCPFKSQLHFVTKYPGGIPKEGEKFKEVIEMKNSFGKGNMNVHFCNFGGGGALWLFDSSNVDRVVMGKSELKRCAEGKPYYLKDDVSIWQMILDREGSKTKYVAGVETNDCEIALHLGGLFGSILGSYEKNNYNQICKIFEEREKRIEQMSIDNIFKTFGKIKECRIW